MPAFDGSIKTKTRVPLDKDAFSPGMGSLVGSGVTEQAKIHGNQKVEVFGTVDWHFTGATKWQMDATFKIQVEGAVNQDYNNDYTYNILGKTDGTHVSSSHYLYVSPRSDNMMSSHTTMNIGPKTSTFVAPLTENHSSPRTINEPTVKNNILGFDCTVVASSMTQYGMSVTFATQLLQMVGNQLQGAILNNQLAAINNQINGVNMGVNILNCPQNIMEISTKAVKVFFENKAGVGAAVGTTPVIPVPQS
jgi:hypothetical protein